MDYIDSNEYSKRWLEIANCEDKLDWSLSIKTTFSILFNNLTLHDSYWKNKIFNEINELILVIELDGYWNYEFLKNKTKEDGNKEWPYLFIRIPKVISISFSTLDYSDTIVKSSTESISKKEKNDWLKSIKESKIISQDYINKLKRAYELHKTILYDLKGYLEIIHEPEIEIMIIEKDGTYINPSIKKIEDLENIKTESKQEFGLLYRIKKCLRIN